MKSKSRNRILQQIMVLTLCILPTFINAQKIEISLYPETEFKEKGNYRTPKFDNLIKVDDGYLSYEGEADKKVLGPWSKISKLTFNVELIKYDTLMNVVKTNALSSYGIKFGFSPSILQKIGNKYYLVAYEYNEEEETVRIKIGEINQTTLSISNIKELVKFNYKNIGVMKAMAYFDKNKLSFATSPDKTKSLIFWQSGMDNSFAFSVVDKEMNVLWSKNKLIDIPEDVVVISTCLDNFGNVYTAYKTESKKLITGHVLICQKAATEKDILVSEDEMYQILLVPSSKANIINVVGNCFGNSEYISSVFSSVIDIDKMTLNNYKKFDFELPFVESFAQNGMAFTRKNKFGMYPFKMEAFELEDGTVDIIGQLTKADTREKFPSSSSSTTLITKGSICNVQFKKEAPLFSRIPYSTESFQSVGDGFKALPFKNSMIVLYNDHESNLKQDISEKPSNSNDYRHSILVAATILNNGEVKRELILNLEEDRFIPLPSYFQIVSYAELFIVARKLTKVGNYANEIRLGTLKVK